LRFLSHHWEKLLLVLFLIGLMACSQLLLANLKAAKEGMPSIDLTTIPGNKPVPPIELGELADPQDLPATQLKWYGPDNPRGSVFAPRKFILCANPSCQNLIPYETQTCPYCGRDQGLLGDEERVTFLSPQEDPDGDGIPTTYEDEYHFLDPDTPYDAERDYDGDWFTNLQEYLADTDPEDPSSHPPLAQKLRVLDTEQRPLGIIFTQLMRGSPADKDKWDLFFNVEVDGDRKTRIVKVGGQVGDYTVTDVRYRSEKRYDENLKTDMTVDVSVAELQKGNGRPIRLVRGEESFAAGATAKFVFIPGTGRVSDYEFYTAGVGDTLELVNAQGTYEEYVVQSVDTDEKRAVVNRVGAAADLPEEQRVISVRQFDPLRDAQRDLWQERGVTIPESLLRRGR
jgi:hypothetical protein